uniref:Uncharacterized protein n=1 Tax=Parascaris equorum TaxID=6256 RepID=A0A914S370_PAREQ
MEANEVTEKSYIFCSDEFRLQQSGFLQVFTQEWYGLLPTQLDPVVLGETSSDVPQVKGKGCWSQQTIGHLTIEKSEAELLQLPHQRAIDY